MSICLFDLLILKSVFFITPIFLILTIYFPLKITKLFYLIHKTMNFVNCLHFPTNLEIYYFVYFNFLLL